MSVYLVHLSRCSFIPHEVISEFSISPSEKAPQQHRIVKRREIAERRDLANALLRAAWSAALEETRILLLDLLVEVDEAAVGGWG